MLCGGLQENLSRENGSTEEKALPPEAQGAVPPANCHKRSSHRCTSPSAPTDDEEPAAKKQTVEQSDVPISLVVPKVKKWISLSVKLPIGTENFFPV